MTGVYLVVMSVDYRRTTGLSFVEISDVVLHKNCFCDLYCQCSLI